MEGVAGVAGVVEGIAPVVPFLAETMYQNLVVDPGLAEGSVHHCDYPVVDESLIDSELSADMEALLGLVSLGSAARNSVKIKVRQPLAELRVQPSEEVGRRALQRFADQICEELNIKQVTPHDPAQGPPDEKRPVQGQYRGTWAMWQPPNDDPRMGKLLARQVIAYIEGREDGAAGDRIAGTEAGSSPSP